MTDVIDSPSIQASQWLREPLTEALLNHLPATGACLASSLAILLMIKIRKLSHELTLARHKAWSLQTIVSHEISTPLQAIHQLLEMSLSANSSISNQHELILAAKHSSRNLLELLDTMLTQSKLDMGRLTLYPQATQLISIVQDLQQLYLPIARQKNLLLTVSFDCPITDVLVDPLRLRQILSNLLSNAIKFTTQGEVSLQISTQSASDDNCQLTVRVTDTGIGITPAVMQQLERPFAEAGEAARAEFGGNGIGLYLCQQLTRLMRGQMQISSQPGAGTQIELSFSLPRASALDSECSMPPALMSLKLKALIVEDETANQILLKHQLESFGLSVSVCEDGLQALDCWRHGDFDIVFCDMHLPRLSGSQLCRKIRQIELENKPKNRTFIIGISGDPAYQFDRTVVDCTLLKPMTRKALRQGFSQYQSALSQAADGAPLCLDVLAQLAEGDRLFEQKFIESALYSLQADTENLTATHAQAQPLELADTLHRLIGVTRLLCPDRITDHCKALESALRQAKADEVQTLLPQVQADLDSVIQALRHQFDAYRL